MQAIVATTTEFDAEYSALTQVEVAKPSPTGRDILVAIRSIATNPVDTKVLDGSVGPKPTADNPVTVGWDASGVVEAVGDAASLFKPGDEVYFAGSLIRPGTFADFTLVDERVVARKPKNLSWGEAAAVPLTTITAWEALVKLLGISIPNNDAERAANAKKSVLIIAGAGGVGSIATQIAKRVLGLTVLASASRGDTVEWVKKNGADHSINHYNPLKPQVEALGLAGVNYILCCSDITAGYFSQFVDVSLPFGRIAFITANDDTVPLGSLMFKSLSVSGELMFTRPIFGDDIEYQHELLTAAAGYFEQGVLTSTKNYEYEYSLENIRKALALQKSGKAIGKIVLNRA